MKILWFTNTPSLYKKNPKGYNGGGWIESLEKIISEQNNIELGVSFFHVDDCFKTKVGDTTYYPISLYNSKFKKVKHYLNYNSSDGIEVNAFMNVVRDYKPDLIHVFGCERSFGLISELTNIPVVIHIQGVLSACLNAYYAPGVNEINILQSNILKPLKLINTLFGLSFFKHNTKREEIILKKSKFLIGRTDWDKNVSSLYAPNARYFYCSEILREPFYKANQWKKSIRDKMFITSTISKVSYKGFDLIMKTAKLLKEYSDIDFEWNVFGITEYIFWENKLGFSCESVNIRLNGIASSEELIESMVFSDVFVHPSYIDNSPNSICEAQILGMPVISTDVGGISSLIENNKSGILIPANDPYTLSVYILRLFNSSELSIKLGDNARAKALERHDKVVIKRDLLHIYNELQHARDIN